jgi:hypothetical protein
MQDKEFNDLLEDLKGVGLIGPLSRFGSDLDNVVESPGKYKNGANAFFDPETGVRYISHSNGYVRRYVPTTDWGRSITSSYCLNRRKEREEKIIDGRKYTSGVFVLIPDEEERLRLIARGVRNYRKTLKK